MHTTIWTCWDVTRASSITSPDNGRPRCIFNGDVKQLLRPGDDIIIVDSIERVREVYYNVRKNTQEIHLKTSDKDRNYPSVLSYEFEAVPLYRRILKWLNPLHRINQLPL